MSGPAVIFEYDAGWPERAQRLLDEVAFAFSTLPDAGRCAFEHIGSTAVPGLAAKPFLDLQARVPRLPDTEELAGLLEPTCFEVADGSRPDSPGVYRDIPRPGDTTPAELYRKRLFHSPLHEAILHVRLAGSPFAAFVVEFRDWLRAHPAEARRYEELKRLVADRHAGDPDYDDYTRAKSTYFDEIQPRLRAWAEAERQP